MGSTRLNQLGTLVLSSVMLIMLITGCGKSPKDINFKPTPVPDQLNESNLSPVETPVPSSTDVAMETISLYFSDKDLMKAYRIEKSIPAVDKADLPKAAVEEWAKGPEASYKDLVGILPPGVIVEYVKDIDGVANVSFSKEIKSANLGASGEAALLDQLSMVLQQFGFSQTQVLVEGHIEESLLGHMETNGPIMANDPKDYEFMKGTAAGSSTP